MPSGGEPHETLLLRLDVGHQSVQLAEQRTTFPTAHTHRWTVFVRGHNGAPLEPHLIQKVVFQLHHDFANPIRTVSNPPFEITETGYGSFIIPIYIFFNHLKREHYIDYDMNLKYTPEDINIETRVIEFKDPKPELRATLLKAGAEISSNKPVRVQGGNNGNCFQDLFGETLHLASPSGSNEKPKLTTGSSSSKRQSVSPSSTCSSVKAKHAVSEKANKTDSAHASRSQDSDKKRRKPKDASQSSVSNKSGVKHGSYAGTVNRSPPSSETNGFAQCLQDASKLPPLVSPLSDCYGGSVFPSTSTAVRDEQQHNDAMDRLKECKIKKPSGKTRLLKDAEKFKESSSAGRHAKRSQNGGVMEDKARRKKTKSDSGLDSDYSSGVPNAHSPGVASGQHSVGAHDPHSAGSALFSPPDSVRSLDTLQESPASAASSTSTASSKDRSGKLNGCDDDHSAAASSSVVDVPSNQHRLRMLLLLQQKIMTIKEKCVAQRVADVISSQVSYQLTSDCLEFDLFSLDLELVQRLLRIFDAQV